MSLMVVEMVIKIIMKAANLMSRVIRESLTVLETRSPSGRKPVSDVRKSLFKVE